MRFHQKVAVITGVAGGIGLETARAFAREGAKLVLVDLHQESLDDVAAELSLVSGSYIKVSANVANEEEIQHVVKCAVDAFGRIDVLFNNAGIEGATVPVSDYPSDIFELVLKVNVMGVFYGMKHAIPVMKEQGSGVIINTSSIGGLKAAPNRSAYSTSKHAVMGLSKSTALEVAPYGIRVNTINPGPVNTRMMRSIESGINQQDPTSAKEAVTSKVPLSRYAEPSEIAEYVLFLCSDQAKYITGTAHYMDGGMNAL